MESLVEEQLHALLTYKDHSEYIARFANAARELGFDYFAYGMRVSVPITEPKYKLQSNYPTAWLQQYERQGYLMHDPIVKHGLASNTPVAWDESLFKDVRHFWEEAKSFGLHWGWSQSSRLNCSAIGMLTLARSDDALTRVELLEKTPLLLWLNQLSQVGFQKAWLGDMLPKPLNHLSRREIEVLKWCAEGKTSSEIAAILNISRRTANFHTANAIQKLDVNNKTAAVIRALQLGVI